MKLHFTGLTRYETSI